MQIPVIREESLAFQVALQAWYKQNARTFPWRETRDPWAILVAEILLRQTFARKVVPVYLQALAKWPTPISMCEALSSEVRDTTRPLGLLYRAEDLIRIGCEVVERFGGKVPVEMEDLLTISGIGDYTASAIRSFAYNCFEPVLDVNILRLLKRLYGLPQPLKSLSPTKKLRVLAKELVLEASPRDGNYALLDFTATICTHYHPKCKTCFALSMCSAPANL